MANEDRQSLSSAFDDMLKQTRRELDGLYDGSVNSPSTSERSTAPSPLAAPSPTQPSRAPRPSGGSSDAERFLNDRYGDGWRQDILERTRDGDEVVVLCKLTIDDQGIAKTQFGRARILGAKSSSTVAGTVGGISFGLGGAGNGNRARDETAESAAYRTAAEDALTKCVAML